MHSAPRRMRILVVEDEPMLVAMLGRMLARRGHEVSSVATAEQALAALNNLHFDLVIADKNLPGGKNGIELLEAMKEVIPQLDMIMMTGDADIESTLAAIKLGVYDFLLKPFASLDDVNLRIDRALQKRRIWAENQELIAELREANARVFAMNRELEARVIERTEQLEALTLTDDVTGLHNQRFLNQRLPEEIERAQRYNHALSLLMIDLDRFKEVNDTHDHLFGSRLLKQFGGIVKAAVRNVDKVVRYGGDEFCVILPETDAAGATVLAERLRAFIEHAELGEDGQPYRITVSIGVATHARGTNAKALLEAADRALYAAKNSGRNRVIVNVTHVPA
ncbi:MAG: diguanylate cyclase [Deltaproteobacteria bacterium]|nr:diguanylate cyclase [Deltaproteobacteria bacterium]